MIGNNFTVSSRDAWVCVPGNEINLTNNANGKPTQIDYISNNILLFSQIFTYDENGNPINIKCIKPTNTNQND